MSRNGPKEYSKMFHNREKLVKTAKAPAEKSLSAREALEQKLARVS